MFEQRFELLDFENRFIPRSYRKKRSLVIKFMDIMLLWVSRSNGRRELASLPDRMLHDMGLNRADVEAEYAKPFWKA